LSAEIGTLVSDSMRVERAHRTTGDSYSSHLGGIDTPTPMATTATSGTLRLTRVAYTVTAYADGQQLQTLIAQNGKRLGITLAATLDSCENGTPCSYAPRWHRLRLNSGHLVNQP
jgi:hypothetical protein